MGTKAGQDLWEYKTRSPDLDFWDPTALVLYILYSNIDITFYISWCHEWKYACSMFFMHLNQIQDEAHTSLKGKLKISNTKMLNRVTWMIIRQIYWWKCKDNSNSVCHVFQALKRHLANLKIEACWVFIIGSPVYLYLKLLCLCLCSWKSYALKAGFIDILCHFRAAERVVPQYSLVLDMSFYVLSKQMPMQLLHIYHTPGNEW